MFGDFKRDLLKHDYHAPTNDCLDSFTSMFLPPILQPTRIRSSSKTLIDSTFSNTLSQDSVSGSHNSSFCPIFMKGFGLTSTKKSLFLPI